MSTPEKLIQSMAMQYQQSGVQVQVLPPGNPETPDREAGLKTLGRAFDMVQMDIPMYLEGGDVTIGGGASVSKQVNKRGCNFSYYIRGSCKDPAKMTTELTGEKKGLISKKLVDVAWQGGLAAEFGADAALKSELIANGIDNLKVEAIPSANLVKITNTHKIHIVTKKGGMVVKVAKHSYENLPPPQKIATIEKIAHTIKSKYMG
jgi:hypothetical protein